MIGSEQLSLSVQAATVMAPVAVYFLLLGLLNSRPRPQLLTARSDFILLNVAVLPIFCLPVLSFVGASAWTLPAAAGAILAVAAFLAPRAGQWVVYNISMPEALRAAERALRAMGLAYRREGRALVCPDASLRLRLRAVTLLRNVSLSAEGDGAARCARQFHDHLAVELARVSAGTSPMAATFLLLATTLIVTPLGLFADRMPEIVRIITDLVR